jgi:DNA-binding response OmpR family regulator
MFPVLLLDPHVEKAIELAARLSVAGFPTRLETNTSTALAALREGFFIAVIVVANMDDADYLAALVELRRRAARSWMIVVSDHCDDKTRDLIFRHGGDACVVAPPSADNLISRLEAFRLRSRPTF